MRLTPGVSIQLGETVTRQTLYDLVANAAHDSITQTDLSSDLVVTFAGGSPPIITKPGQIWWNTTDQVMLVFTDEIDNTGCSLYLAFGPDRFDIALLADEPIPFGAAVVLSGSGRRAKLPPTPHELDARSSDWRWDVANVVGFNQNGRGSRETTASGQWFACAAEGYCWCWMPVEVDVGGGVFVKSRSGLGDEYSTLINSIVGVTANSGISMVRGGIMPHINAKQTGNNREPYLVQDLWFMDAGSTNWARRVFYGPRVGRPT